jgi:hypothetical protein
MFALLFYNYINFCDADCAERRAYSTSAYFPRDIFYNSWTLFWAFTKLLVNKLIVAVFSP